MRRVSLVLVLITLGQRAQGQSVRANCEAWATYYAEAYQVPAELVKAIIDEESGWDPNAVSAKGAVGLMQLMPATAVRFGVRNRFHAEENIRGGVAYLAWLKQGFQGDLRLITAAYYAGEVRVLKRGLDYSSPDVTGYVTRVARRYRLRLKQRQRE